MKITPEQVSAYIQMVKAVADGIKELGEVPSGHLYAVLMPVMSQDAFERILGHLTNAGLVEQTQAHLLIWKGPQ